MSILHVTVGPAWLASSHATWDAVNELASQREVANAVHDAVWDSIRLLDDVVSSDDGEHLIVLCPETGPESAETLAARLRQAVRSSTGHEIAIGVATFPSDALAFDELVEIATRGVDSRNPARGDATKSERGKQAYYSAADGTLGADQPVRQEGRA